MKLFHKKIPKWLKGLLISLGITLLVFIFYLFSTFERIELNAYDFRFKLRGERTTPSPVKIIAIDDASLNVFGKWPWKRQLHAQFIKILKEYGVNAIMYDILFIEPDIEHPYNDRALVEEANAAENVYFPFYFPRSTDKTSLPGKSFLQFGLKNNLIEYFISENDIVTPLPGLLDASAGTGYVNGYPDDDGVTRSAVLFIRYLDRIYPIISFRIACDFLGVKLDDLQFKPGKYLKIPLRNNTIQIPVDDYCQMLVNYSCGIESFNPYSFADIMTSYNQIQQGKNPIIDLSILSNKIILIGTTATGTTDLKPIPFSSVYPMVGVHASIIDTIVNENFIRTAPVLWEILLLLLLGCLMGIIIPKLKPISGVVFTLILTGIYLFFNYHSFATLGISFKIIYPMLLIFLSDLSIVIYRHATEEKEKKWIRNVFSTYITPSVVNKILKEPESLKLGGERREMTVYFSDLSGFTTISESLSPEDLVHLINEYLSAMTDIIFKHEGTLDKYEGDAIMAFWNAPIDQHDHAFLCCRAALDCLDELGKLQKKWEKEGRPQLSMRIGINTGPMIVGNMGSNTRMDYTVMGDSVNLGARLESANKEYNTTIMISESTKKQVESRIECRELDALKVKGKNKPIHVYELMALKGNLSDEKTRAIKLYNQGLLYYKGRKWPEGIKVFTEALGLLPNDGPVKTYLSRCKEYQHNPPSGDWDGVWELKTK